ncbi:hypothetical protein Nepgr_019204 [Nepenthes gracilis]|uniref:Major facilitator superfamily (MFS) profile domain-containing protein n=1 Tax=Nepenthes gracilis TaxID=150966 RepID=A0AAD3STM0_NEPGR|nr:hypothetical protein Nepgr_019204 [Nepenthes gracilis]
MGGGPFAYNRNISNGSSSGGASAGGDRLTVGVLVTCIVAASAGLIFGYDIGISGGVTTMVPFLEKFFPEVTKQGAEAKTTVYCVYDSHALTSFTSSLYVAGFISSLVASRLTASFGRKFTMLLGGVTFLIGGALNAAAESFLMLILGRLFFGFGIGFNNQAAPLFLAEVAPPKWRGAFNTGFHLFIGIGVLCASILNYFSSKLPWGWRLSLGCAIFPSLIMLIGLFFISDSPSSLVDRGKLEEARQVLIKLRGEADVENELAELVKASQASKAVSQEPFVIIFQRQYRPHLVMALAIPFFQQISGIFIIAFYAPVLLQSVGSGADSAFLAAIILGIDNIVFILVSTFAVDRCGRRFLFLHGGWLMFLCQAAIGIQLAVAAGVEGTALISKTQALLILLLMCLFGAGFGWSWGPLTWVVPSEIFPLKIRPIGQSISVAINLATTFVLSQTFLAILCRLKFGAFLFYAGWIIIMTAFVALFLPETKGIPLESMSSVWEKHWYWSRFTSERNTLAPP